MRKIAIFLLAAILAFAALLFYLHTELENYQDKKQAHQLTAKVAKYLEYEKNSAKTYSILLAQNPQIIRSLKQNDRKIAIETLEKLSNQSEVESLRFQIHTKDLRAFARSWDFDSFDEPLEARRKGLSEVKKQQNAVASVEVGRLLNIKAIAPVVESGNYLGSVETISSFATVARLLADEGVGFLVLMDKKMLDVAIDMRDFPIVDRYVQASSKHLDQRLASFAKADFEKLEDEGFLRKNGELFASMKLFDFDGSFIALVVAFIGDSVVASDDLPLVVQLASGYDEMSLEELISVRSSVPDHYKALYNKALNKKTQDISCNDLIKSLLLEEQRVKKEVHIR